jgi:hypothetical protein
VPPFHPAPPRASGLLEPRKFSSFFADLGFRGFAAAGRLVPPVVLWRIRALLRDPYGGVLFGARCGLGQLLLDLGAGLGLPTANSSEGLVWYLQGKSGLLCHLSLAASNAEITDLAP